MIKITDKKPKGEKKPDTIDEIMKSDTVLRVKKMVMGLMKPKTPLKPYMDSLGDVYKQDTNDLEKWMAVFVQWENYYREIAEIYDSARTIADSNLSYYWGMAVLGSEGTINEKKEVAKSDANYILAKNTFIFANTSYKALMLKAENCERGYRLVSRIIGKRINIKEY